MTTSKRERSESLYTCVEGIITSDPFEVAAKFREKLGDVMDERDRYRDALNNVEAILCWYGHKNDCNCDRCAARKVVREALRGNS